MAMSAEERRTTLEQRICATGEIEFAAMAHELGVSEMTIRRDIETLERLGVARRVVGGAIPASGKSFEPPFRSRAMEAVSGKAHIAAAAALLLQRGETVLIDSGSSALAVARAVRGLHLGLTIVTPSVPVALELVDEENTTVLLLGGRLRPGELSLVGTETVATLSGYICGTYVMGVGGLSERGVSDYHREESDVKRKAIEAADRVIVVADRNKLGRARLVSIAPLEDIYAIVTDGPANDATLIQAREKGVKVICVEESESVPHVEHL